MKKKRILVVFVLLMAGVGLLVYFGQQRRRSAERYYSGTIEAVEANISFQISGKVDAVLADEGHLVKKDQVLARLDETAFIAGQDKADADLAQAFEALERAKAVLCLNQEALPADVERAKAAVRALEHRLGELESGYRRQEIETTRLAYEKARAGMEDARRNRQRYERLFERRIVSEKDKDAAVLAHETVLREFEQAGEAYELAREGFRKESIQAARANLAEGRAVLSQARSNLKKIEVYEREVRGAGAQVQAATAARNLSEIQLNYAVLKAPFDGIITSRNLEPGEVVSPGREVLSIADLSRVDLKIFVNETEIGRVAPGQSVHVKTDTFADKTFIGRVSFISSEAEFTPKIIQTHKERVKLVYLVKVSIPNPNLEFKPGMPADAYLR